MSDSKTAVDQASWGIESGSEDPSHGRAIINEFIINTYKLVDNHSIDELISWNDDGTSFIVWKPQDFARELLPKHFKLNNFASFVHLLTTYGFQKVVPERLEFAHNWFKRGERALLQNIVPVIKESIDYPKGKSVRGGGNSEQVPISNQAMRVRPSESKNKLGRIVATAQQLQDLGGLTYCALFPRDYDFQEETLLQLWMADELDVQEPMESLPYFKSRSTNLVTGNTLYRADWVTYASLFRSRESRMIMIDDKSNLPDLSPDLSHVSIMCGNLKDPLTVVNGLKRFGQLRMVIFLEGNKSSFKQVPRDFFLSMRLLRFLDLSRTHLVELPSSIASMKSLRYLDLSETPIKSLPEAICCLVNLLTLKLRGCSNISSLPKGMRKLVNLQHLDIDILGQLKSMPQGMGALTNLRTLSAFIVGEEEGCNIRQLINMNNLSGSFCISRLENVLTYEEAKEACLFNKSNLKKLEFCWSEFECDIEGQTKVLSLLRPNETLVELCISGYGGLELPSWICSPTFLMLECITIYKCENCLALPSSLGKLPSLRYLNLINFPKLKAIDHHFFGIENEYTPFQKLEKLIVEDMVCLEEFTGTGAIDFLSLTKLVVKHCPELRHICILSSSLKHLEVSQCARLECLADGKLPGNLETFIIEDCPIISESFLNDGAAYWHEVANLPNVWIDHQDIFC